MNKHTPGPWEIEDRLERQIIRADGFHDEIATIDTSGTNADKEVINRVVAEQEANARLIAAAPEMLEALRKIEDLSCELLDDDVDNPLWDAAEIARAAIAKAEGRE